MTERQKLEKAWTIAGNLNATGYSPGTSKFVRARGGRAMLQCALSLRLASDKGDLGDFVRLWEARKPSEPEDEQFPTTHHRTGARKR